MLKQPVYIQSCASISALGKTPSEIWDNYIHSKALFQEEKFGEKKYWISKISKENEADLNAIIQSDTKYKFLDRSVILAILVARNALKGTNFKSNEIGINFGSSRGATTLFEKYHEEFLNNNQISTYTSPSTTLGNISSWVSHDLQSTGPEISHSITCSTGLHALLNGIAWLQSGMATFFLVGASEAPLTSFSLAQLTALKVYSNEQNSYPCRALDFEKEANTMVLGEAATCLSISLEKENAIAKILGIGYATEILSSAASISTDALCFQKSMKMAIEGYNLDEIDAIIMHAPGTIQGDLSEFEAIKKVFGKHTPLLTTNKWKTGHTFATSGLLNIEMAILMMENQQFIESPFYENKNNTRKLNKILVNAVGFGGNAVSVLISKK